MEIEHRPLDEGLLRRIRSEFLEMPGLRLSREQAQRLWALDAATCDRVLRALVDADFLQRGMDGRYGRIGEGPVRHPPMRMAKASIDGERTDSYARSGVSLGYGESGIPARRMRQSTR